MAERDDFYEDDEPIADVVQAFEGGEPAVTRPPAGWICRHFTITASHSLGRPVVACGCDMTPVIAGNYSA